MPKINVTSSKQNKLNPELDRDDKILKLLESINKNILASNKREETTQKIINELVRQGLKGSTAKSLSDEQARKQKAQADAAELRAKRIDESIRLQNEKAQRLADKEIANAKAALERQKQAELRTATADLTLKKMQLQYKQDIEELQKKSKEAYKDTTLYKAGSNIAGQKSNALSSMAVSAMTGGILSPIIVKTLGLDKPLTAFTNMIGRGIGNLFGSKKKNKELDTYDKKLNSLKKSKDKEDTDNYSSVAKEKDSTGLLARTLLSLKDWLASSKKEKQEAEKKETSILDRILNVVKLVSAVSGLALTAKWLLGDNGRVVKKAVNEVVETTKDLVPGAHSEDHNKKWTEKAGEWLSPLLTISDEDSFWKRAGKLSLRGVHNLGEGTWNFVSPLMEGLGGGWAEQLMTYGLKKWDPDGKYQKGQNTAIPRNILYAPDEYNYNIKKPENKQVPLNSTFYSRNKNPVPAYALNNVEAIRNNVIDPLQQTLGNKHKVTITSSYREPQYNSAPDVGGVKNSKHLTGNAIDFQVHGMSPEKVIDVMKKAGIPFDKAIAEKGKGKEWVHVEYDSKSSHPGVVAKMNANTNTYSVINPGRVTSNDMSWKSEKINTPEENLLNNVSSSNTILNNLLDATITNDGYTGSPTQNNTQQAPTQIFNINQSSKSKDDSIYAFGDVAKSIILSTM